MNIKNIKLRANELALLNKTAYTRILFIMLFVGMIPTVLSYAEGFVGELLYLIATIALLSFDHGYIVSSLKIVRNTGHTLEDQDAFVGIKRFSELFGTYFLVSMIQFIVLFIVGFIGYMVILSMAPQFAGIEDPFVIISMLIGPIAILGIVIMILSVIIGIHLFAVPYLLEQYGYKGMDAVKESIRFIKGHALDLFKLELSYFVWAILIALVSLGLTAMLSVLGILGTVLASALTGTLGIITYIPKYRLALAIFFEEIAYQRYRVNTYTEVNEDTYNQGEDNVY